MKLIIQSAYCLCVILCTTILAAYAGDLRPPFDFETTAVLPKRVYNPRFKNLITFVDQKYGPNGGTEPLGYKLNKNVTWKDVVDGQTDATLKTLAEGKIQSLGYSMSGTAGTTSGVVNSYANIKVPVFCAGITPKFTLAVAVPIIDVDVNADTGFQKSSDGQAFVDDIAKTDPERAQEAVGKLNNAINSKLKRLGYEEIKSQKFSGIGDIKVVGKYQAYTSPEQQITVKSELTLPTGTAPNPNRALDVPTGDGQTDVGAMVIYDRYLDRQQLIRANAYAGYTAQLPGSIEKHLPLTEDESLSADKEHLDYDLGDITTAGGGFIYEFPFGLNLGAGYGFQYLSSAHYSGIYFPSYRYRLLESNTRQILHSATLGAGFSSVHMYREKRFIAPFQVNFTYNKPLAGVNVAKNSLYAFEVVMFF